LRRAPFEPRLGLRADITSGYGDRSDPTLGTFNALFAATAYSGLVGLIGPANAIDLAPSVSLRVTKALNLTGGAISFWRYSTEDGIYGIFQNLLRTGVRSQARHIGLQATVQAAWSLTPHLSLTAAISYFQAGRFLEETPPAKDVQYVTTWATYRF